MREKQELAYTSITSTLNKHPTYISYRYTDIGTTIRFGPLSSLYLIRHVDDVDQSTFSLQVTYQHLRLTHKKR
jgi:hypothetical protein